MRIRIAPDGTIYMLWEPALADFALALGAPTIQRAAYVRPTNDGWISDLSPSGGPQLGPFRFRNEAKAAEVAWLEAHRLGVRAP